VARSDFVFGSGELRGASSSSGNFFFCWSRRLVVTNGIIFLLVAMSRRNQWNYFSVGRDET
jgi:hypothetical protein